MSVTKRNRVINGKRKVYYRAQVYVGGVRVADRKFDTQSAAHFWHDEEKLRAESGVNREEEISRELTFHACLDRYLAERFPRLERSSQDSRLVKLTYLKNCPLSNVKMAHVSAVVVDKWIAWLLRHETARSTKRKSFLYELKFLGAILN